MKQRSIRWLRNLTANKITVLGEIGAYLIFENRTDLIDQAAALQGDAFEPHDDGFTFSSYAAQGRLLHPLMPVAPLYTRYACKYDDIHSVYQDEAGRPIVVLKDTSLDN
jgi:hypothetical protein